LLFAKIGLMADSLECAAGGSADPPAEPVRRRGLAVTLLEKRQHPNHDDKHREYNHGNENMSVRAWKIVN